MAQVWRLEMALLQRFPRLAWALIGVMLLPALYAFTYLSSMWDPASRTGQLPAAIVNLDLGTEVDVMSFNVGAQLTENLERGHHFGFYRAASENQARDDVRAGRALFALIIPPEFSRVAMQGEVPGAGKLRVFVAEGNNYAGAGFARNFASELGHQVNETLNEKRWEAVLGRVANSSDRLAKLREALSRLQLGSGQLHDGLRQWVDATQPLEQGLEHYTEQVQGLGDGVLKLGAGARTLADKGPAGKDLLALRQGGAELTEGLNAWGAGLPSLKNGSQGVQTGTGQLLVAAKSQVLLPDAVLQELTRLDDGAKALDAGLQQAAATWPSLTQGANRLVKGQEDLIHGFERYHQGVQQFAQQFPTADRLEPLMAASGPLKGGVAQWRQGGEPLLRGASELHLGLDTLLQSLPTRVRAPEGTARGMAMSVEPELEVEAPVPNNGLGLAANFIPLALWMGAVMTAFVFQLRRLPQSCADLGVWSQLGGKFLFLAPLTLVQAGFVWAMTDLALGVKPAHDLGLAVTLLASAWCFLLIILAVVRVMGDLGKAVLMMFLILQMAASGGVVPVELTSDFYRTLHQWLPLSWSVQAVRASLFDAYQGDWQMPVGLLAGFAALALAVALSLGRWTWVTDEEHRPALEL